MPAPLANVSQLTSAGTPAYQSRGIVCAVERVRPHKHEPGRWVVTLSAAPVGQPLARIQEVGISAGSRSAAWAIAGQRAQSVAVKLGKAVSPGPARAAHLTPAPPASPVVSEPASTYGTSQPAPPIGPVVSLGVECLGCGGFELTIDGGGYDGTVEYVSPKETRLWELCNELASCVLTITPGREAAVHSEIVARLHARAAYRRSRRQPPRIVTLPRRSAVVRPSSLRLAA
jgi:hypothetical protein